MKNKYIRCSKLSETKFRELLKCFCLDLDAGQTAAILRVNRNTANRYLRLVRERIASLCEKQSPFGSRGAFPSPAMALTGYPGRKIGKGCVAGPPVFGATEKEGRVFTEIPPEPMQPTLKAVIRGRAPLNSLGDILVFRGYDSIMFLGCDRPYYLDAGSSLAHRPDERSAQLACFWIGARRRILKFQGIPRTTFDLHLKECEFRFNNRGGDIYSLLLKVFRENPIRQTPALAQPPAIQNAWVPCPSYTTTSTNFCV
jgi:hypothetical protein